MSRCKSAWEEALLQANIQTTAWQEESRAAMKSLQASRRLLHSTIVLNNPTMGAASCAMKLCLQPCPQRCWTVAHVPHWIQSHRKDNMPDPWTGCLFSLLWLERWKPDANGLGPQITSCIRHGLLPSPPLHPGLPARHCRVIHVQLQQELLLCTDHSNPEWPSRTSQPQTVQQLNPSAGLAGGPGDPVAQRNVFVQDKQWPGIVSA